MPVVLVHREIHRNTGNAGRTYLATNATLHLIEPLGLSLDERDRRVRGVAAASGAGLSSGVAAHQGPAPGAMCAATASAPAL